MTSIGVSALSIVNEPRSAGPAATQPATANVAHNVVDTTRRCLFTTFLLKVSSRSDGGPQNSGDDDRTPQAAKGGAARTTTRKLGTHNGEGQQIAPVR